MATVAEKPVAVQAPPVPESALPPVRLLYAADLAILPDELPTGPVHYELDQGRLVIIAPPGDIHGTVEAHIITELTVQGQRRGLGKTRCGEVGILLSRDPDSVVGADVAFIASASLPIRLSPEGYLETIPDLVAEVRSKNDSIPYMLRRVANYLEAGVKVVWVADPENKSVTAYRERREPEVFSEGALLVENDILPGFQVAVRELFQL